ncbi:MAG: hypothetical protein LBC87_02280 [Fibromonadaceae bacterium]|jgi:hypothetical protein|nr:hypothetical protein [Fibromonadaceae bacterium]
MTNSSKIKKIIIALMLIIAAVLVVKSHISKVEAKTPYIAFNMLLQTQIKVNSKNADYLEFLENSFGASRKQIEQVYSFLSNQENGKDVRWKVNDEIKKSLKEYKNIRRKKKDFFVINILAPYLTLTVNQFYIDSDDSQEIQRIFSEIFGNENTQRNFLGELEKGTFAFNSGGYFNLDYILNLNSLLQTKGFYLNYDVQNKYSNVFKISKAINIQWKNNQSFNIFLLSRIYPNVLSPTLGFSGVFADNVVVIEDFFPLLAKEYSKNSKKRDVDLPSKDFVKSNLKQIETSLIIQTAIHEAKHKADEFEAPNQRLSIDNEISAHLTAAIFSPCPFNGLNSAIERLEGFKMNVNSRALNNVFNQLKNLKVKIMNQNYKPEQLRIELRKIYASYRTIIDNEPLIDLGHFESYVVPVIYGAFE